MMSGDHMPYAELDDWRRQLSRDVILKDERIAALEAQLAEAQEQARLQIALDRIGATKIPYELRTWGSAWEIKVGVVTRFLIDGSSGMTLLEGIEKAAECAEGQKKEHK